MIKYKKKVFSNALNRIDKISIGSFGANIYYPNRLCVLPLFSLYCGYQAFGIRHEKRKKLYRCTNFELKDKPNLITNANCNLRFVRYSVSFHF